MHFKLFKTYTIQTIKLKFPQSHKYKIQQLTMKHIQIAQKSQITSASFANHYSPFHNPIVNEIMIHDKYNY
jgi:hypothetical protein